MNCPNCDCYTPDNGPVCLHWGAEMPAVVETQPEHRAVSYQPQRVSSGGGFGLLTGRNILIIGTVTLVGVLLFFLFRNNSPHAYVTDFPDGPINLTSMVVSDKLNIVDMYSEFCPPCRAIAPYLEKLAKARPDIHVIRIDINRKGHRGIDWGSPIAKQFNLRSIPHFILVDGEGKVLKEGKSAYKKIVGMINETLNQ